MNLWAKIIPRTSRRKSMSAPEIRELWAASRWARSCLICWTFPLIWTHPKSHRKGRIQASRPSWRAWPPTSRVSVDWHITLWADKDAKIAPHEGWPYLCGGWFWHRGRELADDYCKCICFGNRASDKRRSKLTIQWCIVPAGTLAV